MVEPMLGLKGWLRNEILMLGKRWIAVTVGSSLSTSKKIGRAVVEVTPVAKDINVQQHEKQRRHERIETQLILANRGFRQVRVELRRDQREIDAGVADVQQIVTDDEPYGEALPLQDSQKEIKRDEAVGKDQALAGGIPARDVWLALCAETDVPKSRWFGAGVPAPRP